MTTATQSYVDRYRTVKNVEDGRGRTFRIRLLKLSEQSRVLAFSPNEAALPMFMVAAAVRAVVNENGEVPYSFPKGVGEIETMLDMLDIEGFRVVSKAYGDLTAELAPPAPTPEPIEA